MSRVLVVTAVDVEARALARHLDLARQPGHAALHYRGGGVDVACVGPRAPHLARLADLAGAASLVVSAGTCGALAPHLAEGALVVPQVVVTLGGERQALPAWPGLAQLGGYLSVDRVVETAEAKAQLHRQSAALAVDMESATVVAWARALGLPAIIVRGVSDRADRGVPILLASVVDDAGRTRIGHALRVIMTRPHLLAHAVALRRSTSAALRTVASAVRTLAATSASHPEQSRHEAETWSSRDGGRVPRAHGIS